jgi:antitoxin component YwqK of YwqJK toxin-antitoxin module
MKWHILILVIFSLGCSHKPVVYTEEQIAGDIIYIHNTYKPFSGTCVVFFRNTDKVKEVFTVKRGRLNGMAKTWYPNGNLCRKGSYNKGHISGKWMFYDREGRMVKEATFKSDSLNGVYLSYYANGSIKEKGYYKTDRKTGE